MFYVETSLLMYTCSGMFKNFFLMKEYRKGKEIKKNEKENF